VRPLFDYAWDFSGGRAKVRIGDEFAYIDRDGRYVGEMPAFCRRRVPGRPVMLAQIPCGR
jgi:hypothetical protein